MPHLHWYQTSIICKECKIIFEDSVKKKWHKMLLIAYTIVWISLLYCKLLSLLCNVHYRNNSTSECKKKNAGNLIITGAQCKCNTQRRVLFPWIESAVSSLCVHGLRLHAFHLPGPAWLTKASPTQPFWQPKAESRRPPAMLNMSNHNTLQGGGTSVRKVSGISDVSWRKLNLMNQDWADLRRLTC